MIKRYFLIVLLFTIYSSSKAQDITAVKLRLISPGIYLEHALAQRVSISGGAGIGLRYNSDYTSGYSVIYFIPNVKADARVYFSSTGNFSGPYLSGEVKHRFPTAFTNTFYTYGPLIGYQKRFGVGFFNFSIGYGKKQQGASRIPTVLANLEVGFSFGG